MITSLRIENFKCWKDTGEFRLAPITGFFGANSSGKTSILQLLLMLKQTVESPDRNQVLNLGEEDKDYVRLGTLREVLYKRVDAPPEDTLLWHVRWQTPNQIAGIEFRNEIPSMRLASETELLSSVRWLQKNPGYAIELQRFEYTFFDANQHVLSKADVSLVDESRYKLESEMFKHFTHTNSSTNFGQPSKFYGFSLFNREREKDYPLSTIELSVEELFNKIYYLGPLREYPAREYTWGGGQPSDVGIRGKNAVAALLASRLRKPENGSTVEQKVAEWLQRLGLIHAFKIEEIAKYSSLFIVRVKQSSESAFVPITDVGFGVSQVLPVLTLCYYVPQGSILIFEQPEIHLHPAVQTGLADVFIEVARERNLQIILESHSEHLLTRLQRRIAEKAIGREDVQLYFCEREGAQAHLKPLEINNFGFITNWPKNFFGNEMAERSAMMLAAVERQQNGETE